MRLANAPMPRGRQAMREAVMLGRALLGHDPAAMESNILANEALEDAGIPDRGVTVHVVLRSAGQMTSEWYYSVDPGGSGRLHGPGYRPLGPNIKELVVDEGPTPARDRFLRLHQHLAEQFREAWAIEAMVGPRPHPLALQRWKFIDNAAGTLTHGAPDSSNPLLVALSQDLKPSLLSPPPGPDLTEAARELEALAIAARRDGKLAGYATAALLIAARVPVAVAAATRPEHRNQQLTAYFTFALLELGVSAWQAIYGPSHKALREGYQDAVIAAAQDLLAIAEQHRDSGLDGPGDREYFSEQLFLAASYAFASMQLFRFAITHDPAIEGHVRRYATVSEELFVRLQDGLTHQWIDFSDTRLQEERREILAAQRRGDTLTVELLLREGELGLLRPRAARGLLLGQVPWPKFKEVPEA